MGRWANRSRRGGGPGTRPPPTILIIDVSVLDALLGKVIVTFSDDVPVADLTPMFFADTTLGVAATAVVQGTSFEAIYSAPGWIAMVDSGHDWLYTDSAPAVVTPQSGTIG